jgi:hypothetical protein
MTGQRDVAPEVAQLDRITPFNFAQTFAAKA